MGIKRMIRNWLESDSKYDEDPYGYSTPKGTSRKKAVYSSPKSDGFEDHSGITFTVFNASGGKIVEFKRVDPSTGDYRSGLHIIKSEDNFAEELAQIITYESLKGA
jgi:hypothetical protein